MELWLNALLANFENQKNENVGSVAITLGKEKPRFCDSNLLSFYFYWVSRRYNYLNLKLKKKSEFGVELMNVRFLKVCGSKLDNTKKILMSKNSTPIFFFNFHFPVTVGLGLVGYLQIFSLISQNHKMIIYYHIHIPEEDT